MKEIRELGLVGLEREGDLFRIGSSGEGRRVGESRACMVGGEREGGREREKQIDGNNEVNFRGFALEPCCFWIHFSNSG